MDIYQPYIFISIRIIMSYFVNKKSLQYHHKKNSWYNDRSLTKLFANGAFEIKIIITLNISIWCLKIRNKLSSFSNE